MPRALHSVLNEVNPDHLINYSQVFLLWREKKQHFYFLLISEKMSLGSEIAVGTLIIKKCSSNADFLLSKEICLEGEKRNRHLYAKYRTRHFMNIKSWNQHTSPKWCLAVSTLQVRKLSPTVSSPPEIEPQVQSLAGCMPPEQWFVIVWFLFSEYNPESSSL